MLVLALPAAAAAADFLPHRALYRLALHSAKPGGGIVSAEGRMMSDWQESCEGWTLEHRFVLSIGSLERVFTIASNVTTWESRDGTRFQFSVRNFADGAETERLSGYAALRADGGAGEAVFEEPEAIRFALPAGTLFPTHHALVVLAAMERAPAIVPSVVFDGMTREGPLRINAVVGRPKPPGQAALPPLQGLRAWPLGMAFFPLADSSSEPKHEMALTVYENGVSDAMRLDFEDFVVKGILSEVDLGAHPSC